eukprot:GHVT01091695.1.p2 GENE.GHVT01091695.1~~GHVT01091695.1.p2  ORF type:complete len:126 (-),score=5.52 GHVT01091695.1:754-1131(-)
MKVPRNASEKNAHPVVRAVSLLMNAYVNVIRFVNLPAHRLRDANTLIGPLASMDAIHPELAYVCATMIVVKSSALLPVAPALPVIPHAPPLPIIVYAFVVMASHAKPSAFQHRPKNVLLSANVFL